MRCRFAAVCLVASFLVYASLRGEPRSATQPVSASFPSQGVNIHYLDWGGHGEPLVLLAGFGNDAHIFDEFAPSFVDAFHVFALTRRGFGESAKPLDGYDTATRVEDIRNFLEYKKLQRANLVGHSMAGDELTLFAARFPRRVIRLVYLDAAMNRYHSNARLVSDPGMPAMWKRLILESTGSPAATSIVVDEMPPPEDWRVFVAIFKAMDQFKPDYRRIKAPALAIYAGAAEHPMASEAKDASRRDELNKWWSENMIPQLQASREQFRRQARHGKMVVLPTATHYLFLGRTQEEVTTTIREFLLQ